MELIDLSLIKPMLMRSLENPEAIKEFMNILLWKFIGSAIVIVMLTLVIHYIYSLIYSSIKSHKKEKEKEKKDSNPSDFKELLWKKVKSNLYKYRYFFIWLLLLTLSWLFISLFFRLVDTWWMSCKFSPEENHLLWLRATYSLCIFIIASMFIMFCFGNKFVRNIWIFIFILWILFILMWKFISLWCAWMDYEKNIWNNMEWQEDYLYNNILPDSAEISVKNTIIEWEAVNLKVTMLKNGSKMTSYNGTIRIIVTDEDWYMLNDNEYTLPSHWMYTYLSSDLWEKEFQRWLEIKKEWTFYIEIQDLNENEDKILWRQKVVVINKSSIK